MKVKIDPFLESVVYVIYLLPTYKNTNSYYFRNRYKILRLWYKHILNGKNRVYSRCLNCLLGTTYLPNGHKYIIFLIRCYKNIYFYNWYVYSTCSRKLLKLRLKVNDDLFKLDTYLYFSNCTQNF